MRFLSLSLPYEKVKTNKHVHDVLAECSLKLGAQKVFFIIRRSWKTTLPKYLKMDIEKSP